MSNAAEFRKSSYLFGANSTFIQELYQKYLQNPNAVSAEWQAFFKSVGDDLKALLSDFEGGSWANHRSQVVGYTSPEDKKAANNNVAKPGTQESAGESAAYDSVRAHQLIRAYRIRGHLLSNLDPLGLTKYEPHPELDPSFYGFSDEDYDREMYIGGILGFENATLRDLLAALQQTYCGTMAVEMNHITNLEQKTWLEAEIEESRGSANLRADQKLHILDDMVKVEGFEQFLHVKFPGTKRFSIEGAESLIPALEQVLDTSSQLGVREIVLGMPHRGRLNVLTAFMGKPYAAMLSEFQGNLAHPEDLRISGDVKYHLGTSSDRDLGNGISVHLSLTANPSHLEAVNPVVAGKVRAKQDQRKDTERATVMGILLHGDAAYAGQGVVAETHALSDLKGYSTGGTIHIVVNNQIGFTTNPQNARLSPYCTDVGKIVEAPIFHVNGDDPEAVVHAARIAAEYRQKFKKDVVIDIVCYRRHGHNEGDEPTFTQPLMYEKIGQHQTPREVYASRLIGEGVISQEGYDQKKQDWHNYLEKEHQAAQNYKPNKADWLEGKWMGFEKPKDVVKESIDTSVDIKTLKRVGEAISRVPENVNVHTKIIRQLEAKQQMIKTGEGIDWATAEALAFGTLLDEGYAVRLSGQDSARGTFSQRHSVLKDQESEEKYIPLNNISKNQAQYEVINSNLSEFAVLGFEYGYSLAEPKTLVLWEGQFGDFVNGAQVMIDQFITSGEVKWLRMSGLVMLLPHGYEGQGPEHSSGRVERFLQSCAEDNIQVANCTTPANYFHILRRQMLRKFRKPLILMTPKSLLRHKLAVSSLKMMEKGTKFQKVIPEIDKIAPAAKVRRVVICSGKVYYDLYQARADKKIEDVALIRLEQFYPFPGERLGEAIKQYKNAEVFWCQEEPKNMGGWDFVDPRLEEVLIKIGHQYSRPGYVGRRAAASPAAGYMKLHTAEQNALINEALS